FFFFFFNDPATTEIYTVGNTLSLHDALPISRDRRDLLVGIQDVYWEPKGARSEEHTSELQSLPTISYAVFCLKKKNKNNNTPIYLRYFLIIIYPCCVSCL